ncbi:MAG: LacI family transcriptional regulator [Clostridiales bacterium]|nr:LacI family transcriptional regulator [Clostridiales bacterium]
MSLKEIAERVGTSVSTVSRVLNNTSPKCASPELQERIWTAAHELGYRPNEAARALRSSGAGTGAEPPLRISVLMARFRDVESDPFFADLLHCLKTELYAQGALLHRVVYAEDAPGTEEETGSDGVIVLGRCSQTLLEQLRARNRNIVGIWRNPMEFQVDEVVCDGRKAAELAVEHLIGLGHRSIAYIGDCSFESRYVGYTGTLIRHDIPINYRLIKPTDQTFAQGRRAILELLEGESSFSAVFCANDITAVSVLQTLNEERRRIDRPISVISIDDIEGLWDQTPALTTVHIPRQEMAHMAVQTLLDRIRRGHQEAVRIEFPCKIIRRESCFPR